METYKIKEIYEGHFFVLLDSISPTVLNSIIDCSYKYIWGIDHRENSVEWKPYSYTLFGQPVDKETKVRNIEMEFLIPTDQFKKIIPFINQSLHIVQSNNEPPYHMNLNKLKGKSKYDLLKKEMDYLFELKMPGAADYSSLISPKIDFLENVICELKKDRR